MRRARQPEQKALRRERILDAAGALLDVRRQQLPSLAEIAAKSGIAKATVYLYFGNKEEICLALLTEGFMDWIEVVKAALVERPAGIEPVLTSYCRYCVDHPKILYLATLAPLILEQNIGLELAYRFKKYLADETLAIGELVAAAFPSLTVERACRLFIHSYTLTTGLWQHTHPSPVIDKVFRRPELSMLRMDFGVELFEALTRLWQGNLQAAR